MAAPLAVGAGSVWAAGAALPNTEAFAQVTGFDPAAQSRGIATLPGGIPLFKNGVLVGGIGVFFPGSHGYATYEQNFHPVANPNDPNAEFQAEYNRTNAPLVLEAEWMAFAATGGINGAVPIPPLFRPFAATKVRALAIYDVFFPQLSAVYRYFPQFS